MNVEQVQQFQTLQTLGMKKKTIQPYISTQQTRMGWVGKLIRVIRVSNPTNPKIWVGLRMSPNPTHLHPYWTPTIRD